MLKIRYIIRLIGAFLSRFKIIISIALIVGFIIFFSFKTIFFNNSSKIATIGITGRYTINSLPPTILDKISYGLTKLDVDGSPNPLVAKSWSTPDKGKTWIFKIDNNMIWQDGKKLQSSDITYGFEDVVESRPDNETIEFQLQNSYSAFPMIVSKPIFKRGLLGLSNWHVEKLKLSGTFIEKIILKNTQNEILEYRFYPTEEKTKLAFMLGNVDTIEGLNTNFPFNTWKRINVTEEIKNDEYVAIFYNNQDKLLSEKTLRQALTYAIDKTRYGESRAISPISPTSWAYNSQVKRYEQDTKKAKEIIDQYKKDSKIDDITITLSTYSTLYEEAEKIAEEWKNIGVNTKIESINGNITTYQALLAIFDTPDDPDQYSIWHSTQVNTNLTHYSNPRIDKLLEDGRSEMDTNLRKKIYLDFQRFLIEDAPISLLTHPKTYTISRKKLNF